MRFHACVGILPHERNIPQPVEIDCAVRHPRERSVLDYRSLADVVHAVVDAGPLEHLESIADEIAARALALDGVTWCRVTVRKPHVGLPMPLSYAQVMLERARE